MEDTKTGSIVKVSEDRWHVAQNYENTTWVVNNRRNGYLKLFYKFLKNLKNPKKLFLFFRFRDFYCGDDWNYWWLEKFDYYRVLPKVLDKALEVGSGPYSNIRLISKLVKINEIFCVDPLMDTYRDFKLTWVADNARKSKIHALTGKGEKLEFPDSSFDLVVCNNVLDHVEDSEQCLKEIYRVLKPGGYMVFGNEINDNEEVSAEHKDLGHPIRLQGEFLDTFFTPRYEQKLKKVLTRDQGRAPQDHCGTYIFIGQKQHI